MTAGGQPPARSRAGKPPPLAALPQPTPPQPTMVPDHAATETSPANHPSARAIRTTARGRYQSERPDGYQAV